MAIFYDYYQNPPREGDGGKPKLHPRPVVTITIKSEQIAELLSARSSFSSADMKGMLDNLAYCIYIGLSDSQNVHLEGLGTFSLSLESRPVENISEIRSQSIRIKDIHFRPDRQLKEMLNKAEIKRVKKPRKVVSFTEEERFQRILWYIDRYEGINVTDTMRFNHCNHKKAKEDLLKLVENEMIRRKRFGSSEIYFRINKDN